MSGHLIPPFANEFGEAEIVVVRFAERRRYIFAGEVDDLLSRRALVFLVVTEAQPAVLDEDGCRDESLAVEPRAIVETH